MSAHYLGRSSAASVISQLLINRHYAQNPCRSCILLPLRVMNELRRVETQHVYRVFPKAMAASENLALASS